MGAAVEMQRQVEVEEVSYTIQHPTPTNCYDIGVQLMQIVGEPFANMAQAADSAEVAAQVLPLAIRSLMSNIKPKDSLELIKRIFSTVQIDATKTLIDKTQFDLHFRGRPGHMLKVLKASIEFQYSDFFSVIGDAIADVFSKVDQKASLSPSTSAGK